MSDTTGDPQVGTTDSSHRDQDRSWWSEPDPVELFAAGLELALRQLRVEVAGLRAERDGLRLEVEGLRAKLVIAQEQLAGRDNLADTVRQLQVAVARLTLGQAAPDAAPMSPPPVSQPAPLVTEPEMPPAPARIIAMEPVVSTPIVLAAAVLEPEPEPDPEPVPAPIAPPAPAASSEPSAIEQLKARGLWPAAVAAAATRPVEPDTAPAPEPAAAPLPPESYDDSPFAPSREPATYHQSTRQREIVSWDKLSNRSTPVIVDEPQVAPTAPTPPKKQSRLRTFGKVGLAALGALVVITTMLVSVGPRLLPYQTYFVRSGSMEPTIDTGSMVVLSKVDGSQLEPGDIITFKNPDNESMLVTHRIVEIEDTEQGRVFVTKGDANAEPDSWRVPATGTGWKYQFNIPVLGYLFGYLGTPQARLALLIVPAALLGILALVDIWRPKPDEQ
jgi:signal peptidase